MKPKRRWNERTRLMLTLEFAVVLPAAALVILSAWHLKSIERDRAVEAAIQRDFFHFLAISEKQINEKAYELADEVRADVPTPHAACAVTLDTILASHPYVAHLFVYDPEGGLTFRSQPSRTKDADFRSEADDFGKMSAAWLKMDYDDLSKKMVGLEKKGMHYYFFANWPMRGEKRVYQSAAMFLIEDRAGHDVAIGGLVFDAEYLRSQFFPEVLQSILARNQVEEHDKNPAVMMLHPKSESGALAASAGWDGGIPEVERNLDGALPGLTLAIKLRGTTLEALGQRFVRTSFLTLSAITLLLAVGIILTYRNISREMALAKLKSDFVSNVSHELRTPLSLIRLYAETLEMGRLTKPEKHEEYYRIIRKESERLTALINNILDFSRIEAGRKEYDFRETDMGELVRSTIDSYRFQIEQNGFTLDQNISGEVPPLRVDREAIGRSLLNLVNNAVKYSQDRKYIGVNLYRDNGSVKLEVVDHGIGIATHEQEKIFEKFYRVGDPLVHNTKGSGLGLALVRHIVQAHGGQVSVDSTPGEGSKFTISFPTNGRPAEAVFSS